MGFLPKWTPVTNKTGLLLTASSLIWRYSVELRLRNLDIELSSVFVRVTGTNNGRKHVFILEIGILFPG